MTVAAGDPISGPDGFALLEAFTDVRKEFRDDMRSMEGRLMAAMADQSRDFVDFTRLHHDEHIAERRTSNDAHGRFDEYMKRNELDQAYRNGALGAIRFLVDLMGRNWKALAAIAAGLATISGNIHFTVGL